tara:strand:- start:311 stop:745 length:435 start_codon:yes stop_codon:yes gene_type:complete
MYQTFKLLCTYCIAIGIFNSNIEIEKLNKENYSLTIEIEGILVSKGTLYLAMYSTEKDFLKEPYKKKKFSSSEFPKKLTFNDLPKGEYAITIYQDLNNNEKLDKFFSIPLEPYGISNNVNSFPKFKNSKIQLNKNESIKIKIKN